MAISRGRANGNAAPVHPGYLPNRNGPCTLYRRPLPRRQGTAGRALPLTLITGRLRDQWHGMSRTGTAAQLFGHVSEALLSLHPDELRRHRFKEGDLVSLKAVAAA